MNPLISDVQASNVVATAMHYLIEDLEHVGVHPPSVTGVSPKGLGTM